MSSEYGRLIATLSLFIRGSLLLLLIISGISPVFGQEVPAKLLEGATFSVPDQDRNDGIYGELKVALDVNKKGEVERAVVYIGPGWPCDKDYNKRIDKLLRTIERSAGAYKFSPATKDGKPVEARLSLTLKIPAPEADGGTVVDVKGKLVTGGVLNGKAISLPKPAYPSAARAERASGAVSVQVLINEEGTPIWAQVKAGHPLLMFAAREAACGAKFSPTRMSGAPVKVRGVITYNFTI